MSDDTNNPTEVAFRLGLIQGDIKHILAGLERNRDDFAEVDKKFLQIEHRLDTVEKFNVKVLAVVGVLGPLLMVALNIALAYLGL